MDLCNVRRFVTEVSSKSQVPKSRLLGNWPHRRFSAVPFGRVEPYERRHPIINPLSLLQANVVLKRSRACRSIIRTAETKTTGAHGLYPLAKWQWKELICLCLSLN